MERGEPIWQTRSTVPISMPNSSDAVATTTRNSPFFRFQAQLPRKTAVMGKNGFCPQAFAEFMRDALRKPASVNEDECRAVLAGEFCYAFVDLVPHLHTGYSTEFIA